MSSICPVMAQLFKPIRQCTLNRAWSHLLFFLWTSSKSKVSKCDSSQHPISFTMLVKVIFCSSLGQLDVIKMLRPWAHIIMGVEVIFHSNNHRKNFLTLGNPHISYLLGVKFWRLHVEIMRYIRPCIPQCMSGPNKVGIIVTDPIPRTSLFRCSDLPTQLVLH